jgi:hypothetical protein
MGTCSPGAGPVASEPHSRIQRRLDLIRQFGFSHRLPPVHPSYEHGSGTRTRDQRLAVCR